MPAMPTCTHETVNAYSRPQTAFDAKSPYMTKPKQRIFYTIGYEGSHVKEFVATLQRAGVDTLIDVRDVPLSRKPGFSKASLAAILQTKGIAYIHLRGLGDPKPGREAARAGKYELFRRIFQQHMTTSLAQDDLERAIKLVSCQQSCLMCFEQDHCHCHRSIVADHIVAHAHLRLQHLSVGGLAAAHDQPVNIPGLAVA
jgi:uncharacterized protein (DUF488 family)